MTDKTRKIPETNGFSAFLSERTVTGLSIASDLIRGHTDTIVLSLLSLGDSYGYKINKDIMELTAGRFEFKEATLYTAFRRLEQAGLIASYWGDENSGARRRYYVITEKGKERYRQNLREWEKARAITEKLLYAASAADSGGAPNGRLSCATDLSSKPDKKLSCATGAEDLSGVVNEKSPCATGAANLSGTPNIKLSCAKSAVDLSDSLNEKSFCATSAEDSSSAPDKVMQKEKSAQYKSSEQNANDIQYAERKDDEK